MRKVEVVGDGGEQEFTLCKMKATKYLNRNVFQ